MITRFPPSPTGSLHVGGARTALYNYLLAKANNGKFIIRIEDSDFERSNQNNTQKILNALSWLGLKHDNKIEYQSKRIKIYQQYINILLEYGFAYICTCPIKEKQQNDFSGYDRKCRDKKLAIPKNENQFVIRFKSPLKGNLTFNDLVHGEITISASQLDDFIIQRSNGMPTYNFCAVVDDSLMKITHILRGEDHIANTHKQKLIYQALKFNVPEFAHISMIHGEDGKKLSKRYGAMNVMEYKKMGILPEALNNFLLRLGWSYKDKEVFSIVEAINLFNLSNLTKSKAIFDLKKLLWLNHKHLQAKNPNELIKIITNFNNKLKAKNGENLTKLATIYQQKLKTLVEYQEILTSIVQHNSINNINKQLLTKYSNESTKQIINFIKNELILITNWNDEQIKNVLQSATKKFEVGFSQVGKPLRVILIGQENSPAIHEIITALGNKKVFKLLEEFTK